MKRVVAAVAVVLFAVPALAQTEVVVQEPDRVVYQKNTVVSSDDGLVITSEGAKPPGSWEVVRPRVKFETLVKVRVTFADQLHQSVDSL